MGGWKNTVVTIGCGLAFMYLRQNITERPLWMLLVLILLWVVGLITAASELGADSALRKYMHWPILAAYMYFLYLTITAVINRFITTTY